MAAPAPPIIVQPMDGAASGVLARFLGPRLIAAPYSAALTTERVRREIFGAQPPTLYPVRWQQHRHLGAWRAGQLVGFLDAAVGLDAESADVPDYHPLGLIRLFALPDRREWVAPTAAALLAAAQRFWQETGVGYVKAFHLSTGYPCFQAGAGILPGDWDEVVRALTGAGFLLRTRYYCFMRRLVEPLEEVTPAAELNLVFRGDRQMRRYEVYYRRVELVARAQVARLTIANGEDAPLPLAKLLDLYVDPNWRHKDVGKWLLRRVINDATHQGDAQLVVHVAHDRHIALNLFAQQGFGEINYRGYTLEMALTQ